ncbi:MAG: hypothetical protein AB8F94_00440 [Saprospiraceae bacterium]
MSISKLDLDNLRLELSLKAKNGINFIIAASIIWLMIGYIWTLSYTSYDKSVLTFIVGGLMLPLAFLFSKILKTSWTIKDNPLQPLGLWLNVAQLFYFPFLIFILIKYPDYFVMTYAMITGAHFFPYAWFYNEIVFAIMAGVISVGALLLALKLPVADFYIIPIFMSGSLFILTILLYFSYAKKLKNSHD